MIHYLKAPAVRWLLPIALLITIAVYWPGLSGSWLFDDYPNIVDNPGVQPHAVSVPALVRAALSSPASEFKRPLASLSFAANYLVGGLNPWGWKLFNLVVHLLNGVLVFLLARMLLLASDAPHASPHLHAEEGDKQRTGILATLVAAGWMLLPINLTAVLYVVQREESMANLFVLAGLIGYVTGRRRMLRAGGLARCPLPSSPGKQGEEQRAADSQAPFPSPARRGGSGWAGFWLCAVSLALFTALGLLAKETAVMLPLYALLVEWAVFRFAPPTGAGPDKRLVALFVGVLLLPLAVGLAWLLPGVLNSATWATRDFTLGQRLLSEARIVCDYLAWTLLPTPQALSFYHDQYRISTGLLTPWTTLASLLALAALVALLPWLRRRQPLAALGIALFLGCQLLTGTILSLELVYEHRNYFASFGVMLAVVPWLAASAHDSRARQWLLPRRTLLACLLLWWAGLTTATAYSWGDPLRLAQELAARAPNSPRAQYELGRTYIVYSHYDPASPFTQLAYAPLEKAASFPESSILPQQALIFMNSHMGRPLKAAWWDSLIAKLKARKPGVQDESSLAALAQCARDRACSLPTDRMVQAFEAALNHPSPGARLQATYSSYCWNILGDRVLAIRMIDGAVKAAPDEPAYLITQVRMLAAASNHADALRALDKLETLNYGGRLNITISQLRALSQLK